MGINPANCYTDVRDGEYVQASDEQELRGRLQQRIAQDLNMIAKDQPPVESLERANTGFNGCFHSIGCSDLASAHRSILWQRYAKY